MLDSWNDGAAKRSILEFLESITTHGDSFVPVSDRIATFDNDGTLWCERPRYVQAEFLIRPRDAEGATAVCVDNESADEDGVDRAKYLLSRLPDLAAGIADFTRGMTTEAFEHLVREFFDTATHPTLGVPYTRLAYRPMLELIDLLKAHEFRVYVCTAGGRDFVRVISEEMYGIPRDRVIGSAGAVEYRDGDIFRKRGLELPIDEGPGKPVHIWRRTGRKPLLACGNADGDIEMLTIARFALLIRHDDAEREFEYTDKAEEVVDEAAAREWTTVSMRHDFKRIFS